MRSESPPKVVTLNSHRLLAAHTEVKTVWSLEHAVGGPCPQLTLIMR
jgi:hypothetical protein